MSADRPTAPHGTRIRTNLADVGSAIQVLTKEFLQDIGAGVDVRVGVVDAKSVAHGSSP